MLRAYCSSLCLFLILTTSWSRLTQAMPLFAFFDNTRLPSFGVADCPDEANDVQVASSISMFVPAPRQQLSPPNDLGVEVSAQSTPLHPTPQPLT